MNAFRRIIDSERGVALMAVMLALLVLALVVGAMTFATMGEKMMTFGQLRSQQALGAAEAGSYRMLAELRRRIDVDLAAHVGAPTVAAADLHAICRGHFGKLPVNIFTDYAYPGASSDWSQSGSSAVLELGTPVSPIVMSDSATGATIASFYVTLYVRSSERPALDEDCVGSGDDPRFAMWFDYAIVATGRVGNAVRSVCLRSQGADRCADWLPSGGSWSGSGAGIPILVQQEPVSRYAAMTLSSGPVSFYTGAVLNGRVHSNSQIRIAGNPTFNAPVTQGDPNMHFRACGAGADIAIDTGTPPADPNSYLQVSGCDAPRFNSTVASGVTITLPATGTNPVRAAAGITPSYGIDPTGAEVRASSSDDTYAPGPTLRDGVYVMDACSVAPCGIYIQGNVYQMVLRSESGRQVILLTMARPYNPADPLSLSDPAQRDQKIIIDPTTATVQRCWTRSGSDPGNGDCAGWASSRSYSGWTFNGVVFVNGAITSDSNPAASSGLYGMINRNTRLTLAVDNEIRITDHLVYETPPAASGHNPINVLGLWSRNGNVTIVGALTPNDVYVDAAVLAPQRHVLGRWVERPSGEGQRVLPGQHRPVDFRAVWRIWTRHRLWPCHGI